MKPTLGQRLHAMDDLTQAEVELADAWVKAHEAGLRFQEAKDKRNKLRAIVLGEKGEE